jgi:predicted aspartyl protease
MVDSREPIYACEYCDYSEEAPQSEPRIEIFVGTRSSKRKIEAVVDTGCSPALVIPKPLVRDLKLKNFLREAKKMTSDPAATTIQAADGRDIPIEIYKTICQVGEVEKAIKVIVMDIKKSEPAPKPNLTVCLGRKFLNEFDVHFGGGQREVKFYHPPE